jgi:hypothetical protein
MLDAASLRTLVREVLREEVGRLRGEAGAPRPQVREEVVAIRSDADLTAFVARLLDMTKDGKTRGEIEAGRWVFRLAGGSAPSNPAPAVPGAPRGAGTVRFDSGLVAERQVEALPDDVRSIEVGRRVRFTPLARDRLRQRGIAIRRTG